MAVLLAEAVGGTSDHSPGTFPVTGPQILARQHEVFHEGPGAAYRRPTNCDGAKECKTKNDSLRCLLFQVNLVQDSVDHIS